MSKFSPVNLDKAEGRRGYSFMCPGCECNHYIQTNKKFNPFWEFNDDIEKPTVSPSILVRGDNAGIKTVCHIFIKEGNIQFLNDCTHELAGETVELPEWG